MTNDGDRLPIALTAERLQIFCRFLKSKAGAASDPGKPLPRHIHSHDAMADSQQRYHVTPSMRRCPRAVEEQYLVPFADRLNMPAVRSHRDLPRKLR